MEVGERILTDGFIYAYSFILLLFIYAFIFGRLWSKAVTGLASFGKGHDYI